MSKIIRSYTGSREHLYQILTDYVADIESNGITQLSIAWHAARKNYITGTTFNKITTPNPINNILQLLSGVKTSQNVAMMWGIMFEDTVTKVIETKYSRVFGANCFICDSTQNIAYSPDGFIIANTGDTHEILLLEIKCPYSRRTNLHKVPPNYSPQIELGMYITGLKKCLFVQSVFTRISLANLCINTRNIGALDVASTFVDIDIQPDNNDDEYNPETYDNVKYYGFHIIYDRSSIIPEIRDYGLAPVWVFEDMMYELISGNLYSELAYICDKDDKNSRDKLREILNDLHNTPGIIGILPWQISLLSEIIYKSTEFAQINMHKVDKYVNINKKIAAGESPITAVYTEFGSKPIPITQNNYIKKLKFGK